MVDTKTNVFSSLVFGGGNRSILDGVNFVSRSVAIGKPVIAININYRVGLGGFLASKDMLKDMKRDGLEGVGNWGLTDQQVALTWVQSYVSALGGDPTNVTAYGLSAGGLSIGHQLRAREPPVFSRAICMSGVEHTIPTMTLDDHEAIYKRALQHFNISGSDPQALKKLRAVPELDLADATFAIYAVPNVASSPCDDGVFHLAPTDPEKYYTLPTWLKSYMVGDVRDEGEIFIMPMEESRDYTWFMGHLCREMSTEDAAWILSLYDITPESDLVTRISLMKTLFGEISFGYPQRRTLQACSLPVSYGYHFDLVS